MIKVCPYSFMTFNLITLQRQEVLEFSMNCDEIKSVNCLNLEKHLYLYLNLWPHWSNSSFE